jgi:hypothetical protein
LAGDSTMTRGFATSAPKIRSAGGWPGVLMPAR